MSLIRRISAAVALVDSLLVLYVFYPPGGDTTALALIVIGVLLLVDSGLCFYGLGAAFYGAAVLSLLLMVASFLGGRDFSGLVGVMLLLSAVCVVVGAIAARSGDGMSEQGNPMNLPVFG